MRSIFRLCAALAMAVMMAGGFGAATLAAAGNKKGGDGQAATCAYLWSVMTYPYVSPSVLVYAVSLYYGVYHCDAQ